MLDLKSIRTNPEIARKGIKDRGGRYLPDFENLLAADGKYRKLLQEVEVLRAKKNELSSAAGKARSQGPEAMAAAVAEANRVKEQMQSMEAGLSQIKAGTDLLLLGLPNIPDQSVTIGKTEAENRVVREDISKKKDFTFKPLDHQEIGEKLGILDFAAAGKLSGSRFALLKGQGAGLERAITQFMLDLHTVGHGYTEIFPPFLVTPETMTGTGQLPKFEEELYKTAGENPMYLIPTAEVPVTNMFRGDILDGGRLPMKFTAYTACFRQEAGSYGKDTRGLIRNHQFNKVELVWFTKPEESPAALEQLTRDAETILLKLGLPYRVLELCTGDLGFSSRKTYDLEVWMPGENRFREISSCSVCGDFQARRMNTRFRREKNSQPEFVHTLNGSGVAVGRTFAAILENFQNEDGSVTVPEALRPYLKTDLIKK